MSLEITPEYLASQGLSSDFVERFNKKFYKTESCWLWKGMKSARYGRIIKQHNVPKEIFANRASWILHRGPIPEGMLVCHNCPGGDNKRCVNPEHLFLGTYTDNIKDSVKKGTHVGFNKGHIPHNTLPFSRLKIAEIKKFSEDNEKEMSLVQIASFFGIGATTVLRIKRGNHRLSDS